MTPEESCYFHWYESGDPHEPLAFWAGSIPLSQAYAYEPVPAEFIADEAQHILGTQFAVWTDQVDGRD